MRADGRKHPLYRAIKIAWWALALYLSASVLIGVIRGTFIDPPAPPPKSGTP